MTIATSWPNVVEVFSDVWCPYAHVGIRRFLDRRRAIGRLDLMLRTRAWPLELVNGQALDVDHVAATIEDLRGQVSPHLFLGFDPATFPATTLPALDLISDANRISYVSGEQASMALRHALFERGRDISDPALLDDLREELRLPPAGPESRTEVLADWADGQSRGVIGSPHFFVGSADFFCPALTLRREGGHLQIGPNLERFNEFFARCAAA